MVVVMTHTNSQTFTVRPSDFEVMILVHSTINSRNSFSILLYIASLYYTYDIICNVTHDKMIYHFCHNDCALASKVEANNFDMLLCDDFAGFPNAIVTVC